ncbi:hypothetical protein EDD29_6859 [Actinocorallia herbida]|uniref:Uncharacterized protein n=1 Tax=Actinocorallia herbida TaxID=58109 RepID=A0A3N1D6L9_9ACTN|nr:hypothetical protein EDD29_6859 [Actinocorallia herbida]
MAGAVDLAALGLRRAGRACPGASGKAKTGPGESPASSPRVQPRRKSRRSWLNFSLSPGTRAMPWEPPG